MEKVSIITVSYNSALTIRDTIESVLSQDYENIEYIIIDGLSKDETPEIVRSYGNKIAKFVSEKDQGLYDAMNKGIDLATGEIIGIINSDDIYDAPNIIRRVMQEFSLKKVDSVFGDLYYFRTSSPDKVVRYYKASHFSRRKVPFGILPPHPTFFVRKEIYTQFGKFDLQFKYASDFDLMARFLYVHSISYSYIPMTMVRMRLGGLSTEGFKRIIEINKEDMRSCRKNRIPTNFLFFHIKYFFKVLHVKSLMGLLRK